MKKTGICLRIAACALFMLSSLVFTAVGGWQLVSGDWRLFENDLVALMQIVARILLALYCFGISLNAVVQRKRTFLWEGIQLLAITLAAAPFVSNHLGWLFVGFAALFLLSELCMRRFAPADAGGTHAACK